MLQPVLGVLCIYGVGVDVEFGPAVGNNMHGGSKLGKKTQN